MKLTKLPPVRIGGDNHNVLSDAIRGIDICLSIRTYNCLFNYGISTIYDLAKINVPDLPRWRCCGKITRLEITEAIEKAKSWVVFEETCIRPHPWYEFAA